MTARRGDLGTLLIVEDDVSIAELLQLYLSREGYRVLTSVDGTGGIDLAKRERPNLIVLISCSRTYPAWTW